LQISRTGVRVGSIAAQAGADQSSRPPGCLKLFYAPARCLRLHYSTQRDTRETGILGRKQAI
jgi:hypothetical protein